MEMMKEKLKLVRNVSVPLGRESEIEHFFRQKFHHLEYGSLEVERRSLDARHRNHLVWQYNILAELKGKIPDHPDILEYHEQQPYLKTQRKLIDRHPFIIGARPAGLFCALALVERGFEPWVFEQGDMLEERDEKIKVLHGGGELDPQSNIQFGEGGAGAYSDGKLTARNRDYYTNQVLKYLVQFGAAKEIFIESYPHLGTDVLKRLIKRMREYLESRGTLFFWRHQLKEAVVQGHNVIRLQINEMGYVPEVVILAVGNAARPIYRNLLGKIPLEAKALAMGFRLEHKQDFLNKLFYGEKTDISLTGAASYRIKGQYGGRGVYSFCMCPGGVIVNGASERGGIVTNGMSYAARAGRYGNSAIVAQVDERDYRSNVLGGLEMQEEVERKCYEFRGSYQAPAQKAGDYLVSRKSEGELKNTFLPGIYSYELGNIYNTAVNKALKEALSYWEKHYPGFAREGILVAPETRTSAPVRILRDAESLCSVGAANLYPVGEGAGYAGGIISSAADGYKTGTIFD